MSDPGLLYVSMQPKPGLPLERFHEWYNNEHGPTRLRLPQIFAGGFRYRATDGDEPTFLAVYDVTSMAQLETETYLALRRNRSSHEAETIAEVDVGRHFYRRVQAHEAPGFAPVQALREEQVDGGMLLLAEEMALKEGSEESQYEFWFAGEHAQFMQDAAGCLRSRLFKKSPAPEDRGDSSQQQAATTYLALYDFAKDNTKLGVVLGKGAQMASPDQTKPFDAHLISSHVTSVSRRTYSLFYVFGPASRDLESLSKLPSQAASSSYTLAGVGLTTTTPGPDPVISSGITTADSLTIPYRLEGNPAPNAPTVAFCNSLLTSLHMWDPLVAILKRARPDLRILRYDTRGRHAVPQPPVSATLDMLADDLATVLDALRISKLEALIGVSMGGATALNFALGYPERLAKFIACDFNAASSPANTEAWKQRIVVAEEDAGRGIAKLAEQTVARWFHPATMDKPGSDVPQWMRDMVGANNVEGFKHSCTALWDYDLRPRLSGCSVPGMLVVGDWDGKGALVKAMAGFQGEIGKGGGVELKVVPNTGHLPMCEDPEAFWEVVRGFL